MEKRRLPDRRLYFLLAQAQHRLSRYADDVLGAELGITAVQCGALMYLRAHDGALLKELGDGLSLQSSAITGLAERLVRADLVARMPCPDDGRASRLSLTRNGRRVVEAALPRVRAVQAALAEGFTEHEIDIVVRFLSAVIARFPRKEQQP